MAFADGALIVPAPLTPAQVNTGFSKCGGLGIRMNSQGFNATVRYLETLISGGPDKFVAGLGGYDATTNVLSLTMSDGSTVPINMTALIADALDDLVPDPDVSGTQRGWVNNVAEQELGGIGKRIHGIDIWRSSQNDVTNTAIGATAGFGNTANLISAFGQFSLLNNTGLGASGFGRNALSGNTGPFATGLGYGAGETSTAANLTAIGAFAGQAGTAADSVYAGVQAGDSADGARSIGIGVTALTGNQGTDAVAIGRQTGFSNPFNNVILLGNGVAATADNQTQIGNAAMLEVRTAGAMFATAFTNISDMRNKDNIVKIDGKLAAEFAKRVNYVSYDMMTSFDAIARDKEFQSAVQKNLIAANKRNEKLNAKAEAVYQKELAEYEKALKGYDVKSDKKSPVAPDMPVPRPIHEIVEVIDVERVKMFEQANVIAQEIQALTEELGAFGYMVKTSAGGELSIDSVSFNGVVNAGYQHAIFAK